MTSDQSNEHQRKWTVRGWQDAAKNVNYDRSRAHLNFEIGRGGVVTEIDKSRPIHKRIMESLASRGIKDPNEDKLARGLEPNRRTVVNIIFGGSRETMNRLAFGDQQLNLEHGSVNSHLQRRHEIEEWAKDVYRFACDKWGEDNVVSFVVHLDETNVHAHCTVLPVTPSNKISFKKMFGGASKAELQQRMRQLHDDFAVICKRWNLDRGDDKRVSGAKHLTTKQYHLIIRRACDELELELGAKQLTAQELENNLRLLNRSIKGLTTMVENLQHRESELMAEIERLESVLDSNSPEAVGQRNQIFLLENQLERTRAALEDKQLKLKIADHKLQLVQEQIASANQQLAEAKTEVLKAAREKGEQMCLRLTDSVFNKIVAELRNMLKSLTPAQRTELGSDFLETIATQPTDLLRCAMYLMAGYIDGTIQIAETHGGGASPSDLRWDGRNPGESDCAFAFRCLLHAHLLLKPKSNQVLAPRR